MLRLPLIFWKMQKPAGTACPLMTLCNFINYQQASSTLARVRTGLSIRRLRLSPTGSPTRIKATIPTHSFSSRCRLLHPLGFIGHRTDTQAGEAATYG